MIPTMMRRATARSSGSLSLRCSAAPIPRRWCTTLNIGGPQGKLSAPQLEEMADEFDSVRMAVRGYSESTFLLNDTYVCDSVLLFEKSFLIWEAKSAEDITIDSLSFISTLFPLPEVLFIGTGERFDVPLDPEVGAYFKSKGTVVEVMNSYDAATTYSYLNQEGRSVAAALLVPIRTEQKQSRESILQEMEK